MWTRRAWIALGAAGCWQPAVVGQSVPGTAEGKWPSWASGPGQLALGWVEQKANGEKALRFAEMAGQKPGEIRTIAAGPQLMLNWADFPSVVALGDGRYAAHWLERPAGAPGAYGIRIAFSQDAGRSWKVSFASQRPKTEGYEGFVSFSRGPKELLASFLDHSEAVTKLRLARFGLGGEFLGEEVIDNDVCSCCQTSLVHAGGTPVVAYRDHEGGEIRDNAVARRGESGWKRQATLGPDGWKINACPVNGPALDSRGRRVGAAWFTAAAGKPAVKVALSADGGASFGAAVVLDGEKPLGRVDAKLHGEGMVVAWLGREGEGAVVRAARLDAGAKVREVQTLDRVSAARSSGFPRLAVAGAECYVAWTGEAGVRMATLR